MLPALVLPVALYWCATLELRLRRRLGQVLATLLSVSSAALLFSLWLRDSAFIWSHAFVFLGLANLTGALFLWTGLVELRVLNRRWTETAAGRDELLPEA